MRKILFTAIITVSFLLSISNFSMAYEKEIKSISSTLAEDIAKAGKKMIAVVDFTDLQGSVTELGRFLAEEFSVAFAGAGKGFEVVDRTHLKSILTEHKLSATGIIDPQTARKLGQIAGVDALITGTITPFGDSIRLSVKVLDTSTAKVIGASSGDIAKTKAIEELLARGVETGTGRETSPSTLPTTKQKALVKAEVADFTFEAKECRFSGQKVSCSIAVINNGSQTRNFNAYLRNKDYAPLLVDDLGNQYTPSGGAFGGKGGQGVYKVNQDVPPGFPMNLVLEYRGVATTVTYVNVFLKFQSSMGRGFEYFNATLLKIPLSK